MSIKIVEKLTFAEVEGSIDLIYGEFGGGKNYLAAKMIDEALTRGIPVYSSFPVIFNGYDERDSWLFRIAGVLGLKSVYRVVKPENFRQITLADIMSEQFVERLKDLVECLVVVDEGYAARLFDSYRKTSLSVEARMSVYGTRHYDRRFLIVAQRPNAIHVSSRAMVNRFYKCSQPFRFLWYFFRIRLFVVTEYQDMQDDTVDESKPYKTRIYFGRQRRFKMFKSKYLRGDAPNKYPPDVIGLKYGYFDRLKLLVGMRGAFMPRAVPPVPASLTPVPLPVRKLGIRQIVR